MATALASALSGVSVRHEVAMTGEITLRGRVLPVGGLKEKVLAAHRAGITTIIIPEDNRKDLEEIPENVRADITFVEVSHMDEVLAVALARYGASDTDRLQDDLESDEDHVHAAVMVPPTNPPSTHQPPAAL
jgi:ATP-dependent Lon protease